MRKMRNKPRGEEKPEPIGAACLLQGPTILNRHRVQKRYSMLAINASSKTYSLTPEKHQTAARQPCSGSKIEPPSTRGAKPVSGICLRHRSDAVGLGTETRCESPVHPGSSPAWRRLPQPNAVSLPRASSYKDAAPQLPPLLPEAGS